MKVKEIMQEKVFTVELDDMVDRVFFLLHYEKIRHLPVVENGKVVGIVSDRDLYKALGPKDRAGAVTQKSGETALHVIPRKVRHIMRRGVVTIGPETDATKAATKMARKKIGALPVLADNKLVGIVTATDILFAFSKIDENGSPPQPPELERLVGTWSKLPEAIKTGILAMVDAATATLPANP